MKYSKFSRYSRFSRYPSEVFKVFKVGQGVMTMDDISVQENLARTVFSLN